MVGPLIRALRSLAGLDFKGATATRLTSDESHFLRLDDNGEVEFFGAWMSRNCDWVAPNDAQVAIIKKCRAWFAGHGHGYAYVNDRDFDDWYFEATVGGRRDEMVWRSMDAVTLM